MFLFGLSVIPVRLSDEGSLDNLLQFSPLGENFRTSFGVDTGVESLDFDSLGILESL